MTPLETALERVTIPVLWTHFGFPGNPARQSLRSPFRPDQHPSVSIYRNGRRWHDHATGEDGDAADFWAKATGLPRNEACKSFIAYAVKGHSNIFPIARTAPALSAPPAERQKPDLPPMQRGTDKPLRTLAQFRNVGTDGLQLASERGLLWFAMVHGLSAWLVTDSTGWNCQARRLDGGLWQHLATPAKAYTLPGCRTAWPIGITETQSFPFIALVEGTPDLLAAHHFIHAEGRERDVAAVCITGASNRIHEEAMPHFAGKRVRIFPHLDDAGETASERWTAQLESVNAVVDCFDLRDIPTTSGQPVKDLNDLSSLSADAFEGDRDLWSVFP
ncbi:MAG: hypothetical protein HY360_07260 [Verrucomicrobia bacterium]|nr:hypothetical protein [Verrucomicrobiota bacterium]